MNQFKTINQVEKFLAKKGLELTQTNIEKYFEVWDSENNTNVYLSHKDSAEYYKNRICFDGITGEVLS
jgi:hypothetical protein